MKIFFTITVSVMIFFILTSCTKDDDPVSGEQKNWFVVDTLGNPISGAKIVASYYREVFDSTGVIATLQPVSKYSLISCSFYLSDSAQVDLTVKNYFTKDTVKVLINGSIYSAGYCYCMWVLKNSDNEYVLNGVYEIELAFNDILARYNCYMVCYDYDGVEENELEYIAETDPEGRFSFDPLEQIFDYEGEYVSSTLNGDVRFADYVRLWAVKDGYENACIDSLDLLGENEEIRIILKEEDDFIIEDK